LSYPEANLLGRRSLEIPPNPQGKRRNLDDIGRKPVCTTYSPKDKSEENFHGQPQSCRPVIEAVPGHRGAFGSRLLGAGKSRCRALRSPPEALCSG
jgi:hypothetical protein